MMINCTAPKFEPHAVFDEEKLRAGVKIDLRQTRVFAPSRLALQQYCARLQAVSWAVVGQPLPLTTPDDRDRQSRRGSARAHESSIAPRAAAGCRVSRHEVPSPAWSG